MANTLVDYNILAFDVRDPDTTICYCRIDPHPGDPQDCDRNIYGWHAKTYPSRLSSQEILNLFCSTAEHDPMLWPKMAPDFAS